MNNNKEMDQERNEIMKLNRKNYTVWRLLITSELQKRKLFNMVSTEQTLRMNMSYERKNNLRMMRSNCVEFLHSVIENEIYEEIKDMNQPFKIWMHLQTKFSKASIKRIKVTSRELQIVRFNTENFDLFIEKFNKIVRKVEDCGIQLDDHQKNLYLLSSLDRSKRIKKADDFYNLLDCKFDDFIEKIKGSICQNPNDQAHEYSDISNESISFTDDELDNDDDSMEVLINGSNGNSSSNVNSSTNVNLDEINSKLDKTIQQQFERINNNSQDDAFAKDNYTVLDSWSDCNEQMQTNNGDLNRTSLGIMDIPDNFSPIKVTPTSFSQLQADDEPTKVYEDLNAVKISDTLYSPLFPMTEEEPDKSKKFKMQLKVL